MQANLPVHTQNPAVASTPTPAQASYVGFDLETTGVDPFTDLPVSYAFVEHIVPRDAYADVVFSGHINPETPIPGSATAIHGITDAMVADAPHLTWAVEMVSARLDSIWKNGGVIVGMNVSYDLTMIESLCTRLGLETLTSRGIGPVIDVLVADRHYDKWRKGGRKLTDLCAHYGVVLGDAHDAAADSSACLEVLQAIFTKTPELAAVPTDRINETFRAWYQTWLRDFSGYLVKKGDPPISEGRYGWPVQLTA